MSVHITDRVWRLSGPGAKGSRLLLLLAIADVANDEGYAFPGVPYLARKIKMSPRQVTRIIGELENAGELAVIYGGHKRGVSNRYWVLCGKDQLEREAIRLKCAARNAENNPDNLSGLKNGVNPDNLSGQNGVNPDKLTKTQAIAMSCYSYIQDISNGNYDNLDIFWKAALAELKPQLAAGTFDNNLAASRLIALHDEKGQAIAEIRVKDQRAADWVNARLAGVIERTLTAMIKSPVKVSARPPRLKEESNE